MSDKPKRRWYQFGFSIRELMLVTVIVALVLGWCLERASLHSKLKAVKAESAKWKSDAEIYGKALRELPPTGFNYDPSVFPLLKLPNSSAPAPNSPEP